MREIKFRAWNGDYFEYGNFNFKTGCLGCNFSTYVEIDTPQQYTGLKDVNGVEIYEGDIVVNKLGRVCKIEWNEYQGCWDSLFIRDNCKNNEIDKSVGFSVGLVGDLRVNDHINIRLEPGIYFTRRDLN